MNVTSMNPEQFATLVTLLTEIRDRLPAPRSGELRPSQGKTTLFGWAVDGSEGPPTAEQVAMAREVKQHWAESRWPETRPVEEINAVNACIRAGRHVD
jgi:hypothetical protein